jgi:hypothetical protein
MRTTVGDQDVLHRSGEAEVVAAVQQARAIAIVIIDEQVAGKDVLKQAGPCG